MKVRLLLLFLAAWLFAAAPAGAQGCPPAGLPGDIVYNSEHGVFQGCTPLGWKAFHGIPAGFFPARIPGLVLWLDASDPSTITENDGAVSQWSDKSGNGNHATQGTGAVQPTTGIRTVNGLNVLDFLENALELPSALNVVTTGDTTVFVVGISDPAHDFAAFIGGETTGLDTNRFYIGHFSNEWGFRAGEGVEIGTGSKDADPHIFAMSRDTASGNLFGYVDGTAYGPESFTNVTLDHVTVGAFDSGPEQALAGAIGEILVYMRALSDAEMNQVGQYLADKWGPIWNNL